CVRGTGTSFSPLTHYSYALRLSSPLPPRLRGFEGGGGGRAEGLAPGDGDVVGVGLGGLLALGLLNGGDLALDVVVGSLLPLRLGDVAGGGEDHRVGRSRDPEGGGREAGVDLEAREGELHRGVAVRIADLDADGEALRLREPGLGHTFGQVLRRDVAD